MRKVPQRQSVILSVMSVILSVMSVIMTVRQLLRTPILSKSF